MARGQRKSAASSGSPTAAMAASKSRSNKAKSSVLGRPLFLAGVAAAVAAAVLAGQTTTLGGAGSASAALQAARAWAGLDAASSSASASASESLNASAAVARAPHRPPVVNLMPASERASFEVEEADDLPHTKYLTGPNPATSETRAMGATFRSFYAFDMTMWWDDGSEKGVYSGRLRAMGISTTNSYTTHTFHFRNADTDELVASLTMRDDRHMMVLGPAADDAATLASEDYRRTLEEVAFRAAHFEKTGVPWLSYFPRERPVLGFWPADFPGQVHKMRSYVPYHASTTPGDVVGEHVDLTVTVLAVSPRVVLIEDLLSPFEVEHILELSKDVLRRSSVGSSGDGHVSDTRTSENGWLSRTASPVMDEVYRRFGDVLNMTEAQLQEKGEGCAEQLQVVRYQKGQKYSPHHDFGNSGRPEQRFSTLFIYLKNADKGGATSFPKAAGGRGVKVKPPSGSAVLFYSMLPDGNGDDMSLHSGMEVDVGIKVAANLWSWDPHR